MQGKKIVVGITGSIAAYKSCLLIRELIKRGAEVQTVITPAGKEFITPITLSALTHKPVISEFFSQRDGTWNSHVDIGLWADAMVIAPCTASTIGKMAHGIADNMLITTYLSMRAPVFIAPAMDLDMFMHPSTQENIKKLESYGNHIIQPAEGFLASGLEGKGRMEEPEKIADELERFFTPKDLNGKNVLITAGPTQEKIDPVRFISNYSSGKMGYALAEECADRGAKVTLVSGPVSVTTKNPSIQTVKVTSAQDMYNETLGNLKNKDIVIFSAAVADYAPDTMAEEKIKRTGTAMTIQLKENPDIAKAVGKIKKQEFLVGFALETANEEVNAKEKLEKKNLDMIVLNSLRNEGTCFGSNDNAITIITMEGKKVFEKKPKKDVAKDIVDEIVKNIESRDNII